MARRKAAAAAASALAKSTTTKGEEAAPTPKNMHKRNLSNISTTPQTATRSSKRLKDSVENTPTNGKVTPKKSKYFEDSEDEDHWSDASSGDVVESGYEDEEESATDVSQDPTESEEFDSDEDRKPKAKRGRKPQTTKSSTNGSSKTEEQTVSKDLWREGVKTGLGPGKQVFIAKPKPRGDGGTKYVPDKIHPNTMAFLADLKKNNDREWLKQHDPDYRQSWKDWESFVDTLSAKISELDETVPELPPKDLVFRIYRDVRFSSDPTPYKPHFSAAWSRTGRKGPYAAYYVQIQPGGRSFVGGGLWHPEAQPVALLRSSIDRTPERIRSVLVDASVRKHLLGGIVKDEKKAVKMFCDQNAENALKTKPKGYEADHPNIELLRLKNFTLGRKLTDAEVLGDQGLKNIMEIITGLYPFVTFLNSVVMPDEEEPDNDTGIDESSADHDGSDDNDD